ncbi:Pro-kumamolisin, activation domain-containing protein [Lactarius pseudohatsudake]|nr:Pro-kumamolisin, activation domain-containing protein [Lactarius pseudohatsudake]
MRYHWLYALSFLTATPLAHFATPLAPWGDMRVKHTWSADPANWETLGCPSAGTTIDLYIALNPHQESALIDALYQVSDPKHPRYGAHLSKEQVAELVRPHQDTLELVTSWLAHHGVRPSSISTTHGGAWLTVSNVLVSQANEMLGASYQLYRHSKVNDTIIRTVSYALPEVLHAHIQAVAPTTYFASTRTLRETPRRRSVKAAATLAASGKPVTVLSSRDDEMVTPSELRWLYKTSAYVPTAADRNALGVFGYHNEYPSETDLTEYMTYFRSDVQPPSLATFTIELVNGGGYDPDTPGVEASIDVQYASAMAYPTPIIFYSTGGIGEWSESGELLPGDSWLESIEHLLRKTDIPQTVSISYDTKERSVPREYARALCILFAQLGTRGVSVLFPAGDNGVGENCEDASRYVRFVPEFPASCPYLTSVGGTTDYDPEVAAPLPGQPREMS